MSTLRREHERENVCQLVVCVCCVAPRTVIAQSFFVFRFGANKRLRQRDIDTQLELKGNVELMAAFN